jgi:serine O-acetyltransferase
MSDDGRSAEFWRARRARHPALWRAISADTLIAARYRSERHEFRSQLELVLYALRLALVSDAFLALVFYRLKAALQRRGVPILPRLAHRLALLLGQVSIGDPVVVEGGIYVPHGQVVVDGIVEIDSGAVLSPFVSIGLVAGNFTGPVLERDVNVGTGAKILGPLRVGAQATIGAGAVVLDDVPAETTVAGVPAADISQRVR